jgi:hypothetical protein
VQPSSENDTLTYDQPGWHCHDCDDGIIADADNEASDAALRRLKEMVNAASRPEGLEKLP